MEVIAVERKSAVLTPSSLACLATIPTVNLTAGCAHDCLYCYTRGYRTHPGEGRVHVYANTLTLLADELRRKRKQPIAVYFSPSSDPFQPHPEIQDLSYRVMEFLLTRGIGVAFLTKGEIPGRHLALLRAHARLVRAQIGLTTLNQHILRLFEPGRGHRAHAPEPDTHPRRRRHPHRDPPRPHPAGPHRRRGLALFPLRSHRPNRRTPPGRRCPLPPPRHRPIPQETPPRSRTHPPPRRL